MKKKQKKQNAAFESIRRTWDISPVTRVKASKKVYSRKNYKIEY